MEETLNKRIDQLQKILISAGMSDEAAELLKISKKKKRVPTNKNLWSQCIAEAKRKYDVFPSAYSSGYAAKIYKQKGGKWKVASEENSIVKVSDLRRWFKEKWVDISRKDKSGKHPECGREDADSGAYPKCRPSKKVTKETPKISKSLSKKEKEKATRIKRRKETSSSSTSAGGKARKPNYTKLSGGNVRAISKRAFHFDGNEEESSMIKSNLRGLIRNATEILNMMNSKEIEIPEWCQEKIAVSENTVNMVNDFLKEECGCSLPELNKEE
jgi:hypothetical protein